MANNSAISLATQPAGTVLEASYRVLVEQVTGSQHSDAYRLGGVFERTNSDGRQIYLLDLYRRNVIVSGRCYVEDISRIPQCGTVVKVSGCFRKDERGYYLRVHELRQVSLASTHENPFDLIIPHWDCGPPGILDRVSRVWQMLSPNYRNVISELLDKPQLLRLILQVPGSLSGHHAFTGGCLQHSVEMAELARVLADRWSTIDLDTLVTACLVHDVGKAYEYAYKSGRWVLSEPGKLHCHRDLGLQLLTIVLFADASLSRNQKRALLHAITASWSPGFRAPRSPEAEAVMKLDQLSASNELFSILDGAPGSPWLEPHPHKKDRGFIVARSQINAKHIQP
jgi:putative nucleotidyltransferase with HDIG domain